MEKSMELLNRLIPSEILKKAYLKKYKKDEIIMKYTDHFIVYIIEGVAAGVRYEGDQEVFCSLLFKPGEFIGLSNYYLGKSSNWELLAVSKNIKVVIFPEKLIASQLLENPTISNFIHRQSLMNSNKILTGYYIFAKGGAKAFLAYLMILNSEGDTVYFSRYSDVMKMMGISETMLYKITKEFISKKLIVKEIRCIHILDREALIDYYKKYIYSPSDKV